MRELAFLNSQISILLQDLREDKPWEKVMSYEGGLKEFVKYLDQSKKPMIDEPISLLAKKDGVEVNLALWWNDSYYETVNCFTNNIPQKDGGTHLAGLRGALTRVVNSYAQESGMAKKENVQLVGDDIREGLTCVLSIKVADPKFSSQTKDKLVSSEVRPVVESLVNDALSEWFEEHPSEAKNIISIRKALVARTPIKAGETFSSENVIAKRPATGLSPMLWDAVIGKIAPRAFDIDEPIELG